MSNDDQRKPDPKPKFLRAADSSMSRREVLHFISCLGVVGTGAAVGIGHSRPAHAAGWAVIPHAEILELAITDSEYRSRLLAKPKLTLAQEHGVVLGPDVSLIVVQDSLQLVHVVLCTQAGMRDLETGVVADILYEFRTNSTFRQELINNPRQVFSEWTGGQIPEQLDVEVVVETVSKRVIQLPVPAAIGTETIGEVQALWGGGDGWGGWDTETSSIESGQICMCWSDGSDFETQAPNCCFDIPETETPDI
jgi:hypothetical protein